jgi:hypothetical protein
MSKNIHIKGPHDSECEVCGIAATIFVFDHRELPPEEYKGQLWSCSEVQSKHVFCSEHYRPSILFRLDGSVFISTPQWCCLKTHIVFYGLPIEAHSFIGQENYV